MVAVGPDPTTGLLTRNFTLYYGVSDLTAGGLMTNNINGIVSVKDPINTQQVRQPTNTTNPLTYALFCVLPCIRTCFDPIVVAMQALQRRTVFCPASVRT